MRRLWHRGSGGLLHLPVDGTGIKGEGEGEWNARKHGGAKRRVRGAARTGGAARSRRKVHIGIDEETLEIRAVEFTASDVGDAPMLPELPGQIPPGQEIASVTADGAFDTRKCHAAIAARGARLRPFRPQECRAMETRHRRGARHRPRTDGGQCLTPQ